MLGGFGAQVDGAGAILARAELHLEHHVEGAGLHEVFAAAVFADRRILHFIGAHAGLALAALGEGVVKGVDVAALLEGNGRADDGTIDAFHVVALVDHRAPPGGLEVVFELDAEGAEIVQAFHAAVDVGALKDEAAALGQRYEVGHVFGGHG